MKKRVLVAALASIAALVVVACSDSMSPTSLSPTAGPSGAQSLTARVTPPRICHVAASGDTRIISPTDRNYRTHVGHKDAPLSPETCDGIDNDCDGEIDDHLGAVTITCGEGLCTGRVQHRCIDGRLQGKKCVLQEGTPEVCDSVDNDCDGFIDEDAICNPCSTSFNCGDF